MSPFSILLALVSVFLNATAQLLLKAGANQIGQVTFSTGIVKLVSKMLFQPYIPLALLSYVFSVGIWIIVLSKVPVSVAYPLLSIGFILNVIAGYFFFGETLSWLKIIGISVIIFGVILLSRT